MKKLLLLLSSSFLLSGELRVGDKPIVVDYAAQGRPLAPFWAFFGYDEPNYTYMPDGKKLLSELAGLSSVPVYVRCHNLLTTGDGQPALKWGSTNAYTEDQQGRPVYDWHIVDSIFDSYVSRGMKPLAEIGFMPEALSVHPQPYRHHWHPGIAYDSIYTGWAYPPSDYRKWSVLVGEWVRHSIRRYGEKEVSGWLWEVWNEPNIGYWKGTEAEYFTLYDYTAEAVRAALPSARIGGPATTGPSWDKAATWLRDFLAHCATGMNAVTGKPGAPLSFISFHAKGSPKVVDGHVRMNMQPQLADVSTGFEIVRESSFASLPIYITECDPEGCAACGMTTNPANAYRNGTMYSSYTAASFARIVTIADSMGVNFAGAMSWSFEFENQKWFDGFRDLATNGVDKPVLNVFRMYGRMRGNRIPVEGDGALAAGDPYSVSVMCWNYADDDVAGPAAVTRVVLQHIPGRVVTVTHYRIDEEHGNAYTAWKKMGSPQSVTAEQYRQLEQTGQLQLESAPVRMTVREGTLTILLVLPRQAVSLLEVEF